MLIINCPLRSACSMHLEEFPSSLAVIWGRLPKIFGMFKWHSPSAKLRSEEPPETTHGIRKRIEKENFYWVRHCITWKSAERTQTVSWRSALWLLVDSSSTIFTVYRALSPSSLCSLSSSLTPRFRKGLAEVSKRMSRLFGRCKRWRRIFRCLNIKTDPGGYKKSSQIKA